MLSGDHIITSADQDWICKSKFPHRRCNAGDLRLAVASGRPSGSVGSLPRWRTRFETAAAFWETAVWAPLHTMYWGLLSRPDKQKIADLVGKSW
jgi:hypothetical protein